MQAYLYRVAHNWITDYYRRRPPPSEELDPNLESSNNSPQSTIEHMESESLRKALMRLTADQRQAITLKYLEDWSNKQISLALDKSVGAVKSLQQRGLSALKKTVQAELGRPNA